MDSNWFKDLFIDEAKAALNAKTTGNSTSGTAQAVSLVDQTTGSKYEVYVDSGKLTMAEKE